MNELLLKNKLENLEFSAIDIETTGLSPIYNEILEIGVIRFNKNIKISEFQQLIRPVKPIPEETIKIHGIQNKTVQNSPPIEEVLPAFLSFIQNSILVIQNSKFDLSFLIHYTTMIQRKFPVLPVFCTLQLTRKYYPNLQRYKLSYLKEYFNIKTYKIRTSPNNCEHEALNDAFVAMNIFRNCLYEQKLWTRNFDEVMNNDKELKLTSDYSEYLF